MTGKKAIKTARSSVLIRGTANAATERVEVKANRKPYRPARGTSRWISAAKLSPGRNLILARGVNEDGVFSPVVRVRVTRTGGKG